MQKKKALFILQILKIAWKKNAWRIQGMVRLQINHLPCIQTTGKGPINALNKTGLLNKCRLQVGSLQIINI